MDALRREMARNVDKLRKEGAISFQQTPSPKPGPSLRQAIAGAIKSLDPGDPLFSEKAIGAFIESVLLNEFGSQLVNDIEFRNLSRRVGEAMRADQLLEKQLSALVRQLSQK
jgi:hypothetical protein